MLIGDCGLMLANGTLVAAGSAPEASPASSVPAAARYAPSRKKRRRSNCGAVSSMSHYPRRLPWGGQCNARADFVALGATRQHGAMPCIDPLARPIMRPLQLEAIR